MKRYALYAGAAVWVAAMCCNPAQAQVTDKQIQDGIKKLVAQLYKSQNAQGHWDEPQLKEDPRSHAGAAYGGKTALIVYALLTAGESYQDPKLSRAIEWLKKVNMTGVYARGIRAHVWAALPPQFDDHLRDDLYWLVQAAHPVAGGTGISWRYYQDSKDWDHSAAQYALLGIWEAAKRGHAVDRNLWKGVEDHVIATQNADGGWSYTTGESYGSMVAAGLTCLFVTQDYLHAADFSNPGVTRRHPVQQRIDKGLDWFGKRYVPNANPGKGAHTHYYLYGVERVGLASGYKYFNNKDWYATGAEYLLRNPGSGHNVAFSLLFLVRGRVPVFINKLEISDYDWNNRPRDCAKLTAWVSDEVEQSMNWQIVSINRAAEDWLDAPLLYIAGHEPLKLTDAQASKIKRYIDLGGMLVTAADRSDVQFTRSVQELLKKLYPDYALKPLDPEDELNNVVFKLGQGRAGVQTLHNGIRHLAIHLPRGDVSWMLHSSNHSDPATWQLFVNAYYYATEKGRTRPRLESHFIARQPKGGGRELTVGRGVYEGNWNPEPLAWEAQSNFMWNRGKADVKMMNIELDKIDTAGLRFVHVVGTQAVTHTPEQIEAIKRHVERGGVVLFENAGGNGEYARSVMDMLAAAYPDQRLRGLSTENPVLSGKGIGGFDAAKVDYRSYALLRIGQVDIPRLLCISFDDQPRIILSGEDLTEAMLDQPVWGVFGYSSASAQKLMTNIALWATK